MKFFARLALGFIKLRKQILKLVLSGVVESVEDKVTEFEIGDKVSAHSSMRFGSCA